MRLKELRLRQNLNQNDIAKYINKTTQAYSLYERGERDPDSATLIQLADFFDVSVDYLLGHTDQSKPTIPPVEKESCDLPQEALIESKNLKTWCD